MWALILMLQISPNLGELARRQREQQAAAKTPMPASTAGRSAGQGISEFTNKEIGIRLTVPNSWQSRVNIAASKVDFRCSEAEYGCSLAVASEVAPKNLASITDAKRKDWTYPLAARDHLSARDFSLGSLPAFESKAVEAEDREVRYIHVLSHDFGRIYVFTFVATGKQHGEYGRVFDQVLQSFSPIQSSGYAGKSEEPLRFLEEEQAGFKTMVGLFLAQLGCASESKKLCSVEDLIQNLKLDAKAAEPVTSNPDYSFRISGTMEKFEIAATPKRSGVGGFFQDDAGVHYNPRGPAAKSDPLVRGEDLPRLNLIPR